MNRGAKIVIVAVVALFALTGIYYAFSSPKPKATASKADTPGMSAGRISDPIAPGASAPSTLTMGGTTAPTGSAVTPPDNAFAKPATGPGTGPGIGAGAPGTAGSTATGTTVAGTPASSLAPAIAGPSDPLAPRTGTSGMPTGSAAGSAPTILPPDRTIAGPSAAPAAATPTINPPAAPKAATNAAKATASAGMTSYTVKSGDTLSTIAGEFYKDTRKWTVIAKANPGLDPARLKVGTVINVPKDGAGSLEARTAPERASAAARPTGTASGTEHTVAAGETLSQIAERYLGNKGAWKRIYDANKGAIGADPAKLKVGTKLVIPAS